MSETPAPDVPARTPRRGRGGVGPYYPARWRNGLATLPPGIWPSSTVNTREVAKILGVDVRSLERQRARGTGPVQVPGGARYMRTVWYRAWELLVWRNKIIGTGPMDRDSVWRWWMDTQVDLCPPRPEPPSKPPGTPKGEQRRDTNRRLRRHLILRLAEAEDQHAQRLFERVGVEP